MKTRRFLYAVLSIAGVILLFSGNFIFTAQAFKMVSGYCIGFGSAILVIGIGSLINSFMISAAEDKKIKHMKEIEVKDERNVRIRERSGYMAGKIMNYLLCALVLTLGFMNVNRNVLIAVAILPVVYLILIIAFSNYYSKNM